MLKYKGHSFFGDGAACACCSVTDKVAISDPTGTKKQRAKFRAILQLRLNRLRVMVRQIIVDHDLLQLNAGGLLPVKSPAVSFGGVKVNAFQRWIDAALQMVFLQSDGTDLRPQINEAYFKGVEFAQAQIGRKVMAGDYQHRIDTLWQLLFVEMQGISEAVSQQSVRAVANGLLNNVKPAAIARQVQDIIDKVGSVRSQALANVTVIAAFNQAALDTYEAAKIGKVGLVAEAQVPKAIKVGDVIRKVGKNKWRLYSQTGKNLGTFASLAAAQKHENEVKAFKHMRDAPRRIGPGSRISRTQAPSLRTIQRIGAVQRRLEALGNVEVITAGDENVCSICEDIADSGPYTINAARSLIPAHPNCRCAFVPAG